jgi:hypothetical protein
VVCGSLGQIADDGGVGVEQIITGHARLARHTGGNQDNLSALERLAEASRRGVVSPDLLYISGWTDRVRIRPRTSLLVLMWPMSAATPAECCQLPIGSELMRQKLTGS